jgi:hypothetical protein
MSARHVVEPGRADNPFSDILALVLMVLVGTLVLTMAANALGLLVP